MIQGGTTLENYKDNSKYLQKIKPQELKFIIVGHLHQDHQGMIPALYEKGKCNAKIIVPKGSVPILREMWLDSAYINARDVELLNIENDRNYIPFYTEETINKALNYVMELDSNEIIKLNDELSIRYSNAGHIFLSKQTEVFITNNNHTKKILFTSDLGNIKTEHTKPFVEKFEPVYKSNIAFVECTYSDKNRSCTKETLYKDIEKIKTVIEQFCINNNSRVFIPSFALDRTPYILWLLYSTFGKDKNFKIPVIVDSPLSNRLLDCYYSLLTGDTKENFDEMMNWKNLKRVITPEDSKACIADKSSKIILASSGMLVAGRAIKYTQSILPREQDCIMFMGYAGEGTLAWKIKHEKDNKIITINGKPYKNKCQIIDLKSFSSHMQYDDLIKYYKSMNCEKIYLVHGDKNKLDFKNELQNAITDCLKSTKVIAANKGMKIKL